MTARIIETREFPDDLPRIHKDEATAWRYARRTGHEVWEVVEYGPNAGERFLGKDKNGRAWWPAHLPFRLHVMRSVDCLNNRPCHAIARAALGTGQQINNPSKKVSFPMPLT